MANQQTRRALAPTQERHAETRSSTQPQVVQSREPQRHFESDDGSAKRLATALGWFSIGLGLAEVLAPKGLAKLIGVRDDYPILFRILGLREITSGVGILTQQKPACWLWSRVEGGRVESLTLYIGHHLGGSGDA